MINIYCMLLVLLFSAPLYSGEPELNENSGFSITDIFSYEHPLKKGEDEKKWHLNLGTGYMKNQGNIETMDFNYSAALIFDNNLTVFKLNWLGFYGETGKTMDENRWNAQGNFDYYVIDHIELFSFTMSDYNEILGLTHRNTTGAGLKLIFIRNRFLLADLSGAPVYQYEKFKALDEKKEWRWSIRWRGEIAPFDNNITLRYYGYYIPVFGDSENYRLIQDIFINLKLTDVLGINAGYRRDYNTYTPETLEALPLLKKKDELTYLQVSITI